MSQLLLVGNPVKRRRSGKPRTAAQKRATAKLVALNKRRRAGSSVVVRANPAPKRRRRATSAAKVTRRIRRARRNPIAGINLRAITAQLKTAGVAAAGAIGVDALYGFMQSYLPESMQTETDAAGAMNPLYYAAKGAAAIGAGMVLQKVIGANKAAAVVEGSLTVTLYKAAARFMANNVPSLTLASYVPGGQQVGTLPFATNLRGMGQYLGRTRGVTPPAIFTNAPTQQLRGVGAYLSAAQREGTRR